MSAFDFFAAVIALSLLFYYWATSTFSFWKERGVPGPKPTVYFGNFKDVIRGKISFGRWAASFYPNYKNDPLIGIFLTRQPVLVVKDLDLIKDIFIRDFVKFPDRGMETFPKAEPLWQNLVTLEHKRWRPMRTRLAPAFTSGKLKEMFYLLLSCGDDLQNYLEMVIAKNDAIEVREMTARFTTDVIGTCAFGLEMKAMAEDESEFRKMGKYAVTYNKKKIIKEHIKQFAPWLYELLWPIMKDSFETDFFMNSMKATIDHRRNNNIVRHDFIDQIIQIQDHPEKIPDIELTDELLAAQLFMFFLAGFETSSTTISNALYELAQHHEHQDRLREEIYGVLKGEEKLTYDVVKNMKFLNMVFQETLRKYPPAMVLIRRCDAPYTFSNTSVTIPKDTLIMIPVMGIHHDPEIYPDPSKFDPKRFTEESFQNRHPMSFLAFGQGPRNCIGDRLAAQQSKIGIIKILEKFKVDVCEKTEIPYTLDPQGFLLSPLNGIYLKFTKI